MKPTRRKFIKNVTAGGILGITAPTIISSAKGKKLLIERNINPYEDVRYSPNDTIRLAVVGTGIIGHHNVEAALKIKGVELVAACDLYDGRLVRMKEKYGNQIVTTRNYKEIIERKDIDAVLVATSDNWHDQITIDAMKAGKAVYCEKPMVHLMEQGMKVVEAAKKTKSVIEVGSNGMSGVVIKKARELYKSGVLGELIAAENVSDRHSAMGAWQYSIPPNVTKNDLDWDSFQRNTPKVAFDPTRFFRWRNYQAYGTGIAGDMFVHMFSGLNYILDSKGPERIYSSGGLQYWKDGRDVPDISIGLVDYPKTDTHPSFPLQMRVNFTAAGKQNNGLTLVGSEASMVITGGKVTIYNGPLPTAPGYGGYDSLFTFSQHIQDEFVESYQKKYYRTQNKMIEPTVEYVAPQGSDSRVDHWINFIAGIRDKVPVIQDAEFGFRAAAPALAANISYFDKKIVHWDPVAMKLI